MSNLSSLTSAQLKRAAEIQEQIETISQQLAGIFNETGSKIAPVVEPAAEPVKTRKKKKFTAAGLARLRAAQKARWAKVKAKKTTEPTVQPAKKPRKKINAAGRTKIAAGAKARWAKVRDEKAAAQA